MRTKFIIGNWKMYKSLNDAHTFIQEFNDLTKGKNFNCNYGIAANALVLSDFEKNKHDKNLHIFAQNFNNNVEGAFTGEISYSMLKAININGSLVGHSERRSIFHETDSMINEKVKAGLLNNFKVILCIGETLAEYESGKTNDVINHQLTENLKSVDASHLNNLVIAYEPVWAIGTGKNATSQDAENACAFIRKWFEKHYSTEVANKLIIQYGGSVKPNNIKEYLSCPNIDGALVGGASLKATDFVALISAI